MERFEELMSVNELYQGGLRLYKNLISTSDEANWEDKAKSMSISPKTISATSCLWIELRHMDHLVPQPLLLILSSYPYPPYIPFANCETASYLPVYPSQHPEGSAPFPYAAPP